MTLYYLTLFFAAAASLALTAIFGHRIYNLARMRKILSAKIDESTLRSLGIDDDETHCS